MKKQIYLKIKEYNGYDDFYTPINMKDNTWASTLEYIESVLDDKWLDNEGSMNGITLEMEFVDELPEDIDWHD